MKPWSSVIQLQDGFTWQRRRFTWCVLFSGLNSEKRLGCSSWQQSTYRLVCFLLNHGQEEIITEKQSREAMFWRCFSGTKSKDKAPNLINDLSPIAARSSASKYRRRSSPLRCEKAWRFFFADRRKVVLQLYANFARTDENGQNDDREFEAKTFSFCNWGASESDLQSGLFKTLDDLIYSFHLSKTRFRFHQPFWKVVR